MRVILLLIVAWFVSFFLKRVFRMSKYVNNMKQAKNQTRTPKDKVYVMKDGSELIVKPKKRLKKRFDTEKADFEEIID